MLKPIYEHKKSSNLRTVCVLNEGLDIYVKANTLYSIKLLLDQEPEPT